MNKKNIVWWVIGILCILVAVYIVCDKIFFKENDVNFNEDEEIVLVNDKLREIGSPLGWLIIVDGISNQDENGKYNVGYGRDLLSNYGYRQLFVMEYILSYNSNYDKFTVLGMDGNIVTDIPTSDFTTAYISYDDFNEYYKRRIEFWHWQELHNFKNKEPYPTREKAYNKWYKCYKRK